MKKVYVIYWSGTGNTEQMAEGVAEGAKAAGADVELVNVSHANIDMVKNCDALAMGCPSMGAEVLEETEMEPFVEEVEEFIKDKPLALFGSYGWGDGEWMQDWCERMEENGAILVDEGLIINETPDEEGIEDCRELGAKLVQ